MESTLNKTKVIIIIYIVEDTESTSEYWRGVPRNLYYNYSLDTTPFPFLQVQFKPCHLTYIFHGLNGHHVYEVGSGKVQDDGVDVPSPLP